MMSQNPIPTITPGTIDPASMGDEEPTKQARAVLQTLNVSLATNDAQTLESCFYPGQAYWKDLLALTYHTRTFSTPGVIAASLLETASLRQLTAGFELEGAALFVPATPVLQFIDCSLTFKTGSPAAKCSGRILLLPVKTGERLEWKIWILSTTLESLDVQSEDEALLQTPGRKLDSAEPLETDVFIVGGGNAAVALAARLKALGVDSIMAERNANVGDNWARRHDSLKFHVPTSFCELPYMAYDKELQTPHCLTRDDLAEQVRRYVEAFHLNVVNSAEITRTTQMPDKRWRVEFRTPKGAYTVTAKHLVQATGFGSQKPYNPPMADEELYKGIRIHSAQFKNGRQLRAQGVDSVLIVGSANTAFDVLEDCYAAGLRPTMVVRSPTYIVPIEYIYDRMSLGAYDFGVEAADRMFLTLPAVVDAQLARNLFAHFASQEPQRYEALAKAGFPVYDSRSPDAALMHNLIERAGGHYVDVGATALLSEGKAGVKAGVEPVGYTATGLRFSDGSTVDADAVVWCTGFADADARTVVAEILKTELPVDATWGIDGEGEIRGMWKRHLRVDNYWTMGGYTQQHRFHSRTLALQIKAALEGILPPAYRDTPQPKTLST
ncbi:uncharacterized protein P884DRAFT_198332 [Thermothelomyces heterothallicus CBS 202.75]|uniref:uncharacterized protein n=1 Tax=Thermothelomyces heterothallicus CBS 202.75 TaxID=1149848 RepID=UPI0037420C3E